MKSSFIFSCNELYFYLFFHLKNKKNKKKICSLRYLPFNIKSSEFCSWFCSTFCLIFFHFLLEDKQQSEIASCDEKKNIFFIILCWKKGWEQYTLFMKSFSSFCYEIILMHIKTIQKTSWKIAEINLIIWNLKQSFWKGNFIMQTFNRGTSFFCHILVY